MAYNYVKSIAKSKDRGARWVEVDISDMLISEIDNTYRDVKIELTHSQLNENQVLILEDIKHIFVSTGLTFSEWLIENGESSLPTTPGVVSITTSTIHYRDGYVAGFDVTPAKMGSSPDVEWPVGELRDLLMTKDSVSYQEVYDYCLVTVNGLVHRTSLSQYGIYLQDAAYSKELSQLNHFGLMSFLDVGKIEYIDVDSTMLYKQSDQNKHYRNAHVNLGVSTQGKSLIMVVGGYMHIYDKSYVQIGDGLVRIDFSNYPLVQRYYESKNVIDLSTLPHTPFDSNDDQRLVADLIESEAYIEALFDLPQTFFILVDTPHLYVQHHKLEHSGLPGRFYSTVYPDFPLVTERGKLSEYIPFYEDGKWVIACESNRLPNYQFETAPYRGFLSITPQKNPYKPYRRSSGYLLEIGKTQ